VNGVAQIFNLLHRGYAIRQRIKLFQCMALSEALPNAIRRYSRLKACATARSASLLALTLALSAAAGTKAAPADLIFKNGNIYTVNEKRPRAEAIATKGDKIIFAGSNADAAKHEEGARVIDLHGRTVVPGLTDAHYHLSGVGEREMTLNLEGTGSLEEFLARVKSRVDSAKPGEWITGRGWIETFWQSQTFPTRWNLDTVSPNNPVYLIRADGHGAVANSAAIRLAGVRRETSNPFGGEIMRDKQTGEPNGMFLDNAQSLITKHIPAGKPEDEERALLLGVQRSLELGWTQVHIPGNSFREVERIEKLYRQGKIKLRIYNAVRGPSADTKRLLAEGPLFDAFDHRFANRGIKVSFDGALGSKGAALLENYSDYDTAGFLKWREEDLLPMFEDALRKGVQVWTHAIGDRANLEILNLYDKAFQRVPPGERKVKEPRWRIEHAQVVQSNDIPRFAKLGVIPSMQPSHAIGDLHFAGSRLGLKRLEGAYAWQSFLTSGSIIAGGSDAPVERGEPMIEFYAAVVRKDLKGFSGNGWHPEQAVSREQALKMFTIWAAYAAFEESTRGSIESGKLADLTVLSHDIMKISEPEILQARCVMTVVNGEVVYDARQDARAAVGTRTQTAKPQIAIIDPPEKGFFSKRLDFHGIPIKAHKVVVDEALYAAHDRLSMMFSNLLTKQPMVISNLVAAGAALHIIGRDQVTTDLPEWRHDKEKKLAEYNGLTRDQRTRGMGGLLTSCGEENLLKLEKDRYRGRDICLHEFAHNVLNNGCAREIKVRVAAQRQRSLDKGLWQRSYAGSNVDEYFAELTMWYFGTHGDLRMSGPRPENGPEGLQKYDPEGYALMDDFYSGRIDIGKAEPRRRRTNTNTNSISSAVDSASKTNSPAK
jgi:predicted amidohydrolase YtcJ